MREIFYELLKEASVGKVIIDGDEAPIAFNSNIEGNYLGNDSNMSTLVVNRLDDFIRMLTEYIELELRLGRKQVRYVEEDKNRIKALMAYMFVNMSTEDFLNPVEAVRKKIAFLKDTTFSLLNDDINVGVLGGVNLNIKQEIQSIYMETPYRIDFTLEKDGKIVELPYISYGIVKENGEKTCYIYSIMNHKVNKDDEELKKKVNRFLYKLNEGVYASESQEFKDYKEGRSDYYPENISDVTPSFVLSTVIFLTLLQSKGIENIKVVPYLPLRYLSRDIMAREVNDENIRKQRIERNNQIQNNATEKMIRTLRRASYHMGCVEEISYPYEEDEYYTLRLHSKNNYINNEILEDFSDNILKR